MVRKEHSIPPGFFSSHRRLHQTTNVGTCFPIRKHQPRLQGNTQCIITNLPGHNGTYVRLVSIELSLEDHVFIGV